LLNGLLNSKQILARNRAPWVDYIKGICIILVSFRHIFGGVQNNSFKPDYYSILEYLNIFFFSFRMPLFFILSGVFLSSSLRRIGVNGYISQRAKTILYPLLVWGSIHITMQLIFSDFVSANRQPLDYFRLIYQPRAVEQFWYLNALFFVGLIYAILTGYCKLKPFQQLCLGVILYIISAFVQKNSIEIGLFRDILFFYMFFAIGDVFSFYLLDQANTKFFSSSGLLIAILPVFFLLQHYFTQLNLENNDDYFVQLQQPIFFAVAALVGAIFIIAISFNLQKFNKLTILRVIGYHSLYIYVSNMMVTSGTRIILQKVFHVESMIVIVLVGTVMGILAPLLMYGVFMKMGAWWMYTLKKPMEKKSTESVQVVKNQIA
jgi:fucose 4-O-acetylase-like acetyltransferase